MKPSKYNYYYKDKNEALIWNTWTGALVSAGTAAAQSLSDGHIEDLAEETKELFLIKGILVGPQEDELKETEEEIRDTVSGGSISRGGFYRILVTTGCNASCPYCYEKDSELKTMDEITSRQTAKFIIERQKDKPALIEWFGGEPLMNPHAIFEICNELQKAGCMYLSTITTNGSLWTSDLIKTAKLEWRLRKAQITLDGIGKNHDMIKCLPAGTFRDTIRSIYGLVEAGIDVRIRINHFQGQDQEQMTRWIAAEFRDHPGISAYAEPGYSAGEEYPKELMKEVLRLNLILEEAGLIYKKGVFLPQRRHIGCFACDPGNYTIAPDGRIFNCSHNMDDEQCIGDVTGETLNPDERWFLRRQLSDKCRECKLLPVCMGGCRAGELKTAAMTQCPPFKAIIPELMKMQKTTDIMRKD